MIQKEGQLYEFSIKFLDKNHNWAYHPLYFTKYSSSFTYQLKTYKFLGLNHQYKLSNPQNILQNHLEICPNIYFSIDIDQLISQKLKLDDDHIDILPVLSHNTNTQDNSLDIEAQNILIKDSNTSFYYYVKAQIAQQTATTTNNNINLQDVLSLYLEGAKKGEIGCLIKAARIYMEDDICNLFNVKKNPKKSLSYLLKCFRLHGLFDVFASKDHSIKQLALFNIYMDCFENFCQTVKSALTEIDEYIKLEELDDTNIPVVNEFYTHLLKWLSEPEVYSDAVVDILYNLQISSKTSSNQYINFIVGDLLDGSFYAVSQAVEFDNRIELYKNAEVRGHQMANLRLAVMYEALEKFNHVKGIENKTHLSSKDYFSKYQNMQNPITLKFYAHNTLLYGDSMTEAEHYHETLFHLQDTKILMNYCKILHFQKNDKLYKIASKMKEIKVPFFQIPLGQCYEKGIGVPKNFSKALEIYLDLLNQLSTSNFSDSKNFIYYRIGIALYHTNNQLCELFFKLAARELALNLKLKPNDIGFIYDFGRYLSKGRGFDSKLDKAIRIYAFLLKKDPNNLNDKFIILKVKKRIDKLNKQGKNSGNIEGLSIEEILKLLDEVSKDHEFIDVDKYMTNENLASIPNEHAKALISSQTLGSNMLIEKHTTTKKLTKRQNSMLKQSIQDPKNIRENMILSRKSLKKSKTLLNFQESILDSRQRLLKTIDKYKQKNFMSLKDTIYISPHNQNKLNSLDKIINSHHLVITPAIKQFLCHQLEELFLNIAIENHIRIYQENDYSLFTDEDDQQDQIHVFINHTNQLCLRKTFDFTLIDCIKIFIKSPGIFHIPMAFSHTHMLLLFGCGISAKDDNVSIYYFMEPIEIFNPSELDFDKKIQGIYNIAQVIESFHLMKINLINFSPSCIVNTMTQRIKFANPFLPLFDHLKEYNKVKDKYLFQGCLQYVATDYFRSNPKPHLESDVYSFGLWLAEICSGKKIAPEVESENELIEKVKGSFFKDVIDNIPDEKMSQELKKLVLSCLNFHKKKRPNITSVISTIESITKLKSNPITQKQAIHSFFKSLVFSGQPCYDQEKNIFIHLPWNHAYKGKLKKGLPIGLGKLSYSTQWSYEGDFMDGLFHGNGKFLVNSPGETFQGIFENGYPKIGKLISDDNKDSIDIKYIGGWIPDYAYCQNLIQGFILDKDDNKNKQKALFDDDSKNVDYIKTITNSYIEKIKPNDKSCTLDINCSCDCFGNYYLDKVTYSQGDNLIIQFHTSIISKSIKLYTNEYPMAIGLIEPSYFDIHCIDKDLPLYNYYLSTNLAVRYYHFGRKFVGMLSSGRAIKGTCFVDYKTYFPLNKLGGLYKGKTFIKENNRLYIGELRDDKAEGMAIEYINGIKRYEGEYRESEPYGKGIIFDEKGQIYYKGLINNGNPWLGVLLNQDKRIYDGKFKNQINGTLFQGSVFNFSENIRELQGSFIIEEKKYDGKFKIFYRDGSIYEGKMAATGQKSGYGILTKSNGSKYEGLWDNDNLNGKIYWDIGNKIFEYSEGNFTKDPNDNKSILNGFGYVKYRDDKEFFGEFDNDMINGYGIMHYLAKQEYYEGTWINNQLEGHGLHYYLSNEIQYHYGGEYIHNMKNGYGRLYKYDMVLFSGIWKDDEPLYGVLYENNKAIYEGKVNKSSNGEIKPLKIMNKETKEIKSIQIRHNQGYIINYKGEIIKDNQSNSEIPGGYGISTYEPTKSTNIKSTTGIYENGQCKGPSKIEYVDGIELYVALKDDIKNGYGMFIDHKKKGEIYCYFKENKKEGYSVYKDQDKQIKIKYENGKIIKAVYYEPLS